jgi:DNA-binding NarL/FixJ family response regulator
MIKVVIIDSDEHDRNRVKKKLLSDNFEIAGIGKDGYGAVRLAESKKPDILVMELLLEDGESADLVPLIKSKSPDTRVVFLTHCIDEDRICAALARDPAGYIIKQGAFRYIREALEEIACGGSLLCGGVTPKICALFSRMARERILTASGRSLPPLVVSDSPPQADAALDAAPPVPAGLSGLEFRITALIARGLTTRQIAEKLSVTDGTARNYISTILRKTGTSNRNQLILFAIRHGIVEI